MRSALRTALIAGLYFVVLFDDSGYAQTPDAAAEAAFISQPGEMGRTLTADRGYYAMVNGALEKWDFYHDGTFLHEGVAAGAGTSVRTSERGIYRIQGSALTLRIGKTATAFATPGSNSSLIGGGSDPNSRTVKMKIQLLGADGSDGMVLDGTTFHIRHGW